MFGRILNGIYTFGSVVDQSDSGAATRRSGKQVRAFLGVEAASFLLAAIVHSGVLVQGYQHHEAMVAESVIGTVLFLGLVTSGVRPRATFTIALAVQAFALLGTLVGIWTIVVGVGPRTLPDVAYHAVIVVVLVAGIGMARRSRGAESPQAEQ